MKDKETRRCQRQPGPACCSSVLVSSPHCQNLKAEERSIFVTSLLTPAAARAQAGGGYGGAKGRDDAEIFYGGREGKGGNHLGQWEEELR